MGDFLTKYRPKKLTVFAEMGDDQTDIAAQTLAEYGWNFSFFADLRGIERFMRVEVVGE